MKGTLEFNLPEEWEEWEVACKASETKAAIDDFDAELRRLHKYLDVQVLPIDDVRKMLRDYLDGLGEF
jgi:hypothetical protein